VSPNDPTIFSFWLIIFPPSSPSSPSLARRSHKIFSQPPLVNFPYVSKYSITHLVELSHLLYRRVYLQPLLQKDVYLKSASPKPQCLRNNKHLKQNENTLPVCPYGEHTCVLVYIYLRWRSWKISWAKIFVHDPAEMGSKIGLELKYIYKKMSTERSKYSTPWTHAWAYTRAYHTHVLKNCSG
jgi:hypothetical protein